MMNGGHDAPFTVDFTRPRSEQAADVSLHNGAALAAKLPDLECLIREIGLVGGGGAPHLIAGYGFSGKSIALQSVALSLAAGKPIWGIYSSGSPRRILHVDYEQGFRLTARRYQRLAAAMNVDLQDIGDRLAVAIMPPLHLVSSQQDRWRRLLEGRDLCIIDSLRAATKGLDENKSEIRAPLDMLGELAERSGCRSLPIHHSRKPSENAPGGAYAIRGSSAIFDSCDSIYVFSASRGEPVSVQHVKARSYGDLVEDFALVIRDVEIGGEKRAGLSVEVRGHELVAEARAGRASAARSAQARQDVAEVRRVLAVTPGLGTRELRAAVSMGRERVDAALYMMRGEIEVREERSGRAIARRHYLRGTP
jgi:hypothetical protein